MTNINYEVKRKWIYNASIDKCLFAPSKINSKPILKDCDDSYESQWYIPSNFTGPFYSVANTNRCLNIKDLNKGIIEVNYCNDSNIFKYTVDGMIYSPNYGSSSSKCMSIDDNNNTIYYKSCIKSNNQIWSLWDRNPSKMLKQKTQIVWIYNRYLNKCIFRGNNYNGRPYYYECWNTNYDKWEIPISGDGFIKNIEKGWCLNVYDIDKGDIIMGECNNNSTIKDINSTYNKESIISTLNENKCLDSYNSDINTLVLNKCNKENIAQHWEIRTSFPYDIIKCGKGVGNCPSGQCCSKEGICGTMNDHCGTGCQSTYGKCQSNIPVTIDSNAKPKWIYNASTDKCLYALETSNQFDKRLRLKDCEDNKRFKWLISPYPKGYFHSATFTDYCLNVNTANNKMEINDCDVSNTFEYTIDGIIYSTDIGDEKCMSIGNGIDNTKLETCTKSDAQLWSVWDKNPYEITRAPTRSVWIYNRKLKKCLIAGAKYSYRPQIGECNNSKSAKWSVPISGDGFFKSLNEGWCLNISNIYKGTILMKECNTYSIIKDINTSFNGNSIMSSLMDNKCLGFLDSDNVKLNMNICDKTKNDQYWEINIPSA